LLSFFFFGFFFLPDLKRNIIKTIGQRSAGPLFPIQKTITLATTIFGEANVLSLKIEGG